MYQIDIHSLQQFDILLVRFPEDESSLQIRENCNSEYSHAIIYLGGGAFVEGIEPVVTLFSYHRYYFPDLEDVKILRLSDAAGKSFNGAAAERALRSLASCNYSKRLLYHINKKNIDEDVITDFLEKKIWRNGIVCTSLITLPYYAGGVDFSSKNEPFYAHFGDIEKHKDFIDVTALTFQQIKEEDLRNDAYNYFTTYETGSILEKQAAIVVELNKYVQHKYRDITQHPEKYEDIRIAEENLGFSSWEDILPNLTRWFLSETGKKIDEELSELILSSKYNMLWFEEIHKYPEQFFPLYYWKFNSFSPSKDDIKFYTDSISETYKRIKEDEENTLKNFLGCPSKTYHILFNMYRLYADLLVGALVQYEELLKHV
ncbi:hypothetical protein [Flavobacterium defluvii]|uniref:Uncharacterized protein n=1 Tax=Flavobacterium defluvii TaxID=370979 RepID=A0A1M5JD56_9FLAO|nr:hypothetical protein [Flavobacterium defluvii]SHG38492.1 hypothetical protein SAMN05443663_102681 [Flavobacterium defluvii]